nr:macrophage mannose receptor 1 isoform X11 [Syngnathus scovelli]
MFFLESCVTRHTPCDTDHGWNSHGSKCYKKIDTTNGWRGARHDCLWEGGDLVSITSEEEEKFVKEQMGDKPFWIGLSNLVCDKDHCKLFEEGQKRLTWSDTGVTPTYANWTSNQGGSSDNESCAYVNQGVHEGSQPGKWRHGSCGSSLAYMCERSPDDCPDGWPCSYKDLGYTYSRVETSYCDSGEFLYNDSCYHFEGRFENWQEAEDLCKEEGGLLASVHSKVDGLFLSAHRRIGSYSWLGLKKNNGKFEWRDGSSTVDVPWYLPKYSSDCTKLNNDGEIEIDNCIDFRPSICQKGKARASLLLLSASASGSTDHEATCDTDNGWSPHGSNCYKKMETSNGWLGARHDCLWEGGDLVSITSEDEEKFVKEQMGDKPFWIGLSNLNCNETWCQFFKAGEKSVTWSYTSVTPTYANWDPRQDQSSDDESCVYVNQGVHGDSQPSKWRRGSCRSSLAYMCERSPDDCPDGWPCSYKDLGYTYSRVETSYCDSNEFLYKDSCYHFEVTPKTWQAAEDFCKEKRGFLASVHSPVDRRFLAAHVREGFQPWLGLKKSSAKFEWLDGSCTENVTKNLTQNSDDCAKLNENGGIQLEGCTDLRPSICQKGKARASLPLLPASASASGKSAKCGWWQENPANDLCYLINSKPTKTWKEARDECARLRGNLLAITDSNEHTFIRGLLPSGSSLWLDASDIIVEVGSKQSDESSPSSVLLGASNPGDPPGRRCNSLLSGKGGIEVVDCEKKRGYVCKRRVVQTCERTKGWRRFGSNCYKKMETTNGWLGARYDCVWEGGDLVSITSTYEESFVKEQMGDKPFWIGRSNLNCDVAWCQFFEAGEKRLSLSDTGVTPTYANWDSRQDRSSSDHESCAYVNQGVHVESQPGKWRHGSCGSSLAYMCERPLDACPDGRLCSYKDYAFGYNRVETSYCGTGDFLYRDSCYHFEGMKRTWEAAEKFCREWNGHLASVQSLVDSQFLAAHAPDVGGLQSWVGLKKNKNNFEWSDATPTGNIAWVPNGPTGRGDCCALSPTGQVEDWPCTNIRPFICKKAKVQEFVLPPPAGWSAKCGWWPDRSSDDFCYLIQRRPTKTWQKARDDCLRRGGDLLSIADSREQAFIQSLYTFLPSSPSLWLGANNNITKDGSEWTDGSPFRYVVMDGDDPGDLSGASCLSLLTSNGRWKFDDCRKKRGYICKKRGIPAKPQQPLDELSDHEPTCDTVNGWSPHSSNCYKKMETTNGWLGARYKCVWEGGDLVSITSEDEEKFVKEKMGDKPFWIGLSNLNCDEAWCQFSEAGEKMLTWSDTGLTPTYANRDFRQDGSSTIESCAYVNQGVQVDSQPGKWRHGSCRSSLAYMCKRPPNACPEGRLCSYKDYGFGYNRVETSSCDTGNFLYKDSCYHFERMKQTWEGAERFCGKWNGHLASVLSWDEGKFLAAHAPSVRGLQSWVGLKKNKDNFEWSDATPTGNIVWVPNGPKGRGGCSSLSPTGQLEDWPCTESQPFICKKAMVQEFVLPPPAGWSGKCGWWLDRSSDDFCYLIQRRPTKTWQKARDDCLLRGGDLLSITDSHEQAFIQSLYTFLPSAPSLWLGVNNNITKDGSEWTDGSPFGYVLMDGDDPGDLSGASCLSLLTRNGRWKFDDCRKKRGYICKKRGKTPKPSKPHDSFKEILVCNNRSADLVCEGEGQNQSRISIQSAFYGRRSDDVCSEDSDSYDDEYCAVEGILPRYRKMCNGHQKCHIELLEDDSCPATSKYLEMVYSCEHKVCLDSLGIADGSLADSFFKASSSMEDTTPEKARLNGESCWKPSKDPVGSWIQVNLGHKRKVTAIVTQGCDSHNTRSWDIQLEMKVSVDRRKWTKHPNGKFIGGGTHLLETPAFAQYVRILPLENRPEFGLRLDILGCAHDDAMTCARRFNSLHLTDSMTFYCPPGCAKHVVFGTLVYSESSHICAAAIHAGVIQNNIGGDCIVMRAPKQQVYTGSTGNGIISRHLDDPLGVSYTFADGEPRCSAPDWEEFAGFCYKPFDDERDWADGQQVCRGFGAELVSIRTKVEQAWVKNASNFETSDMWTGLNDLALPGMFVWSDRHKVTFTPWAAGEPNQRVALGKHCVALLRQTGKWKLMSCTQVNSFMCKMPTVRFPIT